MCIYIYIYTHTHIYLQYRRRQVCSDFQLFTSTESAPVILPEISAACLLQPAITGLQQSLLKRSGRRQAWGSV